METKTKQIINSLATPVFYIPVYQTPEGMCFLDDNQIYRRPTHSVKARKFDTFIAMAKLTTIAANLIYGPRQLVNLNITDD